jgi:hypothetical protein
LKTAEKSVRVSHEARAVFVGGNRRSGGEGENGDSAAINTSREERLFARLARPSDRMESVPDRNAAAAARFYRVITPRWP